MSTIVLALGLVAGAWLMSGLRRLPAVAGGRPHTVSVVVPARDEATTLPTLLESLRADAALVHEVIVVDDGSSDGTAEVAEALGATVVRLDGDPPAGWTGKAYACARGAAVAAAPLLLFLDADVTLSPRGLGRLLAAHEHHGGLVSVQPHHRVERPYESLSAVCNVVSMMGTGAFAPGLRSRRPAAFGPCLLTSAADYAAAGGHAAVRDEVVEDVHLARRYAAAGMPVRVFSGAGAVSFRMYPGGLRRLIDGWTKSLATGAGLVSPAAVAISVWWITACLAFGLRGLSALGHAGSIGRGAALVAAAGWLAVAVELRWMLRRIGTFRWVVAALHVVPVLAFVALFARSAWLTLVRRKVRWRGRDIAVGGARSA